MNVDIQYIESLVKDMLYFKKTLSNEDVLELCKKNTEISSEENSLILLFKEETPSILQDVFRVELSFLCTMDKTNFKGRYIEITKTVDDVINRYSLCEGTKEREDYEVLLKKIREIYYNDYFKKEIK